MSLKDTNGKKIVVWIIVGFVLVGFVGLDIYYALYP